MPSFERLTGRAAFGILLATLIAGSASAMVAPQGGIARWAGLAANSCGLDGRTYPAVVGVCYYPIDIRARVGRHVATLVDGKGKKHRAVLEVQTTQFPAVTIELPASLSRFIEVSAADKARAAKEGAEVAKALRGEPGPAQFKLPLGKPATTLPKSQDDFGSERHFSETNKSLHTGRDYPVSVHTPVRAPAAGRVVLAADEFYSGNSVYLDHGGGLVTMLFHLESMTVKTGDTVRRGQVLGKVGATGRATGPHLHVGVRWIGRRVDPALLFDAPTKLPSMADSTDEAEQKVFDAASKEPPETDIAHEGEED